ncbi:hypothetical protein [Hyphococcus sp. DH-69]|uniref:hypothetical protein n=1 Tax=Hyphococcus formosus TaxID=3143534 RepID=UPI00398B59BF
MKPATGKLIISIILDLLDFTIGRIPGLEMVVDGLLGVAAVVMWGWPGLIAFWEIADPTGQVDAFVPTLTLLALSQMRKEKSARPDR